MLGIKDNYSKNKINVYLKIFVVLSYYCYFFVCILNFFLFVFLVVVILLVVDCFVWVELKVFFFVE